jgi:putative sigma-54 modulation protein
MTIAYTGRKAHLTPELKAHAESKLLKLEKYLGDILDAHVVLTREKNRLAAEIIVKARARTLTAKAESADFTDAIGVCALRLLTQARKVSGRRTVRRKGRGAWDTARRGDLPEAGAEAPEDGVPEVVRLGRVAVPAMTVREALLRAQDGGGPLLVFRDLASRQVAVIFRRDDGQFALVETEA